MSLTSFHSSEMKYTYTEEWHCNKWMFWFQESRKTDWKNITGNGHRDSGDVDKWNLLQSL